MGFIGVYLRYNWNLVWVVLGFLWSVFFCLCFIGDSSRLCGKVFATICKSGQKGYIFSFFRNADVLLITCQEMLLQCPYALRPKQNVSKSLWNMQNKQVLTQLELLELNVLAYQVTGDFKPFSFNQGPLNSMQVLRLEALALYCMETRRKKRTQTQKNLEGDSQNLLLG